MRPIDGRRDAIGIRWTRLRVRLLSPYSRRSPEVISDREHGQVQVSSSSRLLIVLQPHLLLEEVGSGGDGIDVLTAGAAPQEVQMVHDP